MAKEILFRAARRTGLQLTLVANHSLAVPADANVRMLQVTSGFDVADDEIVRRVKVGDLVITADIPLAAEVIAKGALVLSARGEQLVQFVGEALFILIVQCRRAAGLDTTGAHRVHEVAHIELGLDAAGGEPLSARTQGLRPLRD